MAWDSLKNILSREQVAKTSESLESRVSTPVSKAVSGSLIGRLSMDSIGQRDETVRQRIGGLLERLDDARSLHDEFAALIEPMIGISDELTRASKRNIELEANLHQERQMLGEVRHEALEGTRKLAELSALYSDTSARASTVESELKEALAALEEQRALTREKAASLENIERQLFVETEQRVALATEVKALRVEAGNSDTALSQAEHDIRGLREKVETVTDENRRLQQLSEDQAVELASVRARLDESESQWEADRDRLRRTQSELATERADRERFQTQYETEAAQHRNDRAGISAKFEAGNARIASMEQTLAQVHRQLRDKDEIIRANERAIKEATIARTTAERRLETLQTDADRQRERFSELQNQRAEASSRVEMLTKALAAKDLTIDQVNARNTQLAERADQLNARFEAARSEFETASRRLAEDLENERSERLLAQGALDIARESRAVLQKQHDALKRAGRNWREPEDYDGTEPVEPESNVKPFKTPKPRKGK